MTPAARLQAAIELGAEIDATGRPADAVIDGYFRRRRYAGSGDRRAISGQVFDILRHRARLDWWAARCGLEPTPRSRAVALAAAGTGDPERVAALFGTDRYGPAPLDPGERALVAALTAAPLDHPDQPAATALEIPEWLQGPLTRAFGDDLIEAVQALNAPAPVDLRVNTRRGERDEARQRLAEEGITCAPTPLSPLGLRLDKPQRLGGTRAFRSGLIEVQDEGSQLLALLLGARPGMTVVDYCAGAGGKTLALAAVLGGDGVLHACDSEARRLDRLRDRAKRAGAGGIRPHPLAGTDDPWLAEHAGTADRVLLDVPCSGTGTWRRAPEARWRLTPDDLAGLVTAQDAILAAARDLVKPGGRLVYATCSVLVEENEDRVEAFRAANPDFRLLPVSDAWAEVLAAPCPADGPTLRLAPHTTGTDGFFAAVLERISPSA